MPFPIPVYVQPSGGQIPANIAALQVTFSKALQSGYAAAKPVWNLIAQEAKFDDSDSIILGAVDRTHDFQIWQGTPNNNSVVVRQVTIPAVPYVDRVAIDMFKYRDDHIGIYKGNFEILGQNMQLFPDKLLSDAMFNATATPWDDGAFFFSASHPINPENPAQYGSQSNYFPGTNLTYANFSNIIRPALNGMLAANNRPFNQGAARKRKLVVTTVDRTIADTIVNATIVPTSIQNLDGSSYGVAATSNQLMGAAEVVEMVDLDTHISTNGLNRPYYLFETSLAPYTPFAVGMREAFKVVPLISEDLPNVTDQHTYIWHAYGRLDAVPVLYQSAIMAVTAS